MMALSVTSRSSAPNRGGYLSLSVDQFQARSDERKARWLAYMHPVTVILAGFSDRAFCLFHRLPLLLLRPKNDARSIGNVREIIGEIRNVCR